MRLYFKQDNSSALRVEHAVDDLEHEKSPLPSSLPLLEHADIGDKAVLLRVDHNFVKKGQSHSPVELVAIDYMD